MANATPYIIIMNRYELPTTVNIANTTCAINSDYRIILRCFEALNDPDLLESEQILCALNMFYVTDDYKKDIKTACLEFFKFIAMGDLEDDKKSDKVEKPLYSWEQDYNIIIAPINHILGYDVRGVEYLHWWTFLSAFMEIGESTFNTYVAIRDKLNKGRKLEKYEERILKDNRDKVLLKKKHDSTTQSIMNEIMGKGV